MEIRLSETYISDRPNIRGCEKTEREKSEEELTKDSSNSVLYSHQEEKAPGKDSSQMDHEGLNGTVKEEKGVADKRNGSFLSVCAAQDAEILISNL